MSVVRGPSLVFLYISLVKITFSLLTRESIGKEAELEMKLAIVSNALMKVSSETISSLLEDSSVKKHRDNCRRVSVFQSEAKCEAMDMKMIFYPRVNKTHFHKQGLHLATF